MIVSFLILSFSAALLLISTTGFFFNISIGFFHTPLALLAAVILSYFRFKSNRMDFLRSFLIFFAILFVSAVLAAVLVDFSGDGMGYHMEAILALSRGWNPFKMHALDPLYGVGSVQHVTYYPKALWIMAACIGKTTGNLEMGKLFGFLFAAATFLIAKSFLDQSGISNHRARILLAGLATLNPVILTQLKSFYVDGSLASLLTCFLILAARYVMERDKTFLMYLGLIALIFMNLKYPAVIYNLFLWGCLWMFEVSKERKILTPVFFYMSGSLLVAALWIGYQPYVTNTVYLHTPFYMPVLTDVGQKSPAPRRSPGILEEWRRWKTNTQTWIESWSFPVEFIRKPRLIKLLISLFARSENHPDRFPKLKWPFLFYRSELIAFSETDTKYGGFGPLFCLFLIITAGLFIAYFTSLRPSALYHLLFAGVVTLSALLLSEPWWARFAPQIWLIPLSFLMFLFQCPIGTAGRRIRNGAVVLLLINIFFIFTTCYAAELIRVIDFHHATAYLKTLSDDHSLNIQFRYFRLVNKKRLEDAGVRYAEVDKLPLGNVLTFDIVPYDMKVAVADQKDFRYTYHGLVDIYRAKFKHPLNEMD